MMIAKNTIPFVDLASQHRELADQLMEAVKDVLTSAMFIGGPNVEQFEREFAEFCGVNYCVGVASGTDALRFALMAADIGKDDIVITVPNTFVATIEAVVQAGATPHFGDIDPQTYNMSADAVRRYFETQTVRSNGSGFPIHRATGKTVKALLPVHLYGQMCDMDAIMATADQHGVAVFEDACQAHGSEYFSAKKRTWQKAGSIGRAGAFSFYPGKNLGACGEAGAVTTNDEEIAGRIRMIRDHGQNKKYHHLVEGYNGRLDAIQAALLRVKLPLLNDWNEKRRMLAQTYNDALRSLETLRTPYEPDWSRSNYHLYVIAVDHRDDLQRHLTDKNIGTGLHYPVPLHLQQAFRYLDYDTGDFPVTETLAGKILSLPMFPQLRQDQQHYVVEEIAKFLEPVRVSVSTL